MSTETAKQNAKSEAVLAGNAKPKRSRTASPKKAKRTFPQVSIEECRKIADVIKRLNAGNPWTPKDISSALDMGNSNNFYYLTAASRDYKLTIGTREAAKIELSELGRRLVYPKSPKEESEAIQEAFLNIDLFKKVFDYYQGGKLPDIQYLKNTLKTEFGVEEEFQDDFYDLYRKNLTYLLSRGDLPEAPPESVEQKIIGSSIILGESSNAGTLVAFVAMHFSEKTSAYPKGYFDEVLKHLITPAAVKANFNARTAKKAGSEVIQSTIVNDLDSADLVIVDLTEHNPNVLFELGMRIAFDKPVCLIRAKGTAAIFDIDHMLRVYDYNPCMWPSTLEIDVPALTEQSQKHGKAKMETGHISASCARASSIDLKINEFSRLQYMYPAGLYPCLSCDMYGEDRRIYWPRDRLSKSFINRTTLPMTISAGGLTLFTRAVSGSLARVVG